MEAVAEATQRVDEHWLPFAVRIRAGADGRMEVEQASDPSGARHPPAPGSPPPPTPLQPLPQQ